MLITFPRTLRDLLILLPYFSLSPVAPVDATLYDPARSTKLIFEQVQWVISYESF